MAATNTTMTIDFGPSAEAILITVQLDQKLAGGCSRTPRFARCGPATSSRTRCASTTTESTFTASSAPARRDGEPEPATGAHHTARVTPPSTRMLWPVM